MRRWAWPSSSLLLLTMLVAACPQLEQWKQSQLQASHEAAQGSAITPPAPAIKLPNAVRDAIPLDEQCTTLNYSELADGFLVELLSQRDGAATAAWVLSELETRGYSAEDNPSRIVEESGLSLVHPRGKYERMVVRVKMNTAGQVILSYEAYEK